MFGNHVRVTGNPEFQTKGFSLSSDVADWFPDKRAKFAAAVACFLSVNVSALAVHGITREHSRETRALQASARQSGPASAEEFVGCFQARSAVPWAADL